MQCGQERPDGLAQAAYAGHLDERLGDTVDVATFLQGQGFTPGELYQMYGVVLALSGVTILMLHATYRGADKRDAMDEEDAVANAAYDREEALAR